MCKICLVKNVNIISKPCHHSTCDTCMEKFINLYLKNPKSRKTCPFCNTFMQHVGKIYVPWKIFAWLSILMYYLISCNKLFVLFNAFNTINIQHFVFEKLTFKKQHIVVLIYTKCVGLKTYKSLSQTDGALIYNNHH